MKFEVIKPGVFAVVADTSQELARLFVRFQEHFESPKFKGKYFTLDEFKNWYKDYTNSKTFTYYNDWGGFNVPSTVIEPFIEGKFGKLSTREKWLLSNIKKSVNPGEKYYVIGYPENNSNTIKHELAHAKFYLNSFYNMSVLMAIGAVNKNTIKNIFKYLAKLGYGDNVWIDELHAYVLTGKTDLKRAGLWTPQLDVLKSELSNLYKTCV